MEKIVNKAMDDLILTIKNSNDYKKCMEIKEKLKNSQDVNGLVDEIKKYQKVQNLDQNMFIKFLLHLFLVLVQKQ